MPKQNNISLYRRSIGKQKQSKQKKKSDLLKQLLKPVKNKNNNFRFLNNIISKNINNSREKYFSKGIKLAESELKKRFNTQYKIVYNTSNKFDHDIFFPVMKSFRVTNFDKISGQLVLYEKCKNIETFYMNKYGKEWYDQRLVDITNIIINDIFNVIEKSVKQHKYSHIKFNKKIVFDKDDRYTLYYGIQNNVIYIHIRKIDLLLIKSPRPSPNLINKNKKSIFYFISSKINWERLTLEFENIKSKFYNHIMNSIKKKFQTKLKIGMPLSFLLVVQQENYPNPPLLKGEKNLHIEYGYTYKDSRGTGYSTVLRKLLQIYAYDNNVDYVTTEAVAWGSQKGSKSAGMFQMPIIKNKQPFNLISIENQKQMFKPNNQSFKSLRNQTLRKAVYNKTNYIPVKQKEYLDKKKIGESINWFIHKNIYGTHARKISQRENIPIQMLKQGTKHSLYF